MKPALLFVLSSFLVKLAASTNGPSYRNPHASVVNNFNKTIPGGILLTPLINVSPIVCGIICANSDKCVSFFYNKQTTGCQIYAGGLNAFPIRVEPGIGYKYYRFIGGMIGHSCFSNEDCRVEHSECRMDGVCGCKAGYGYHHANMTCDSNCEQFGETFQIFKQTKLKGLDKKTISSTTSEQCAQLCVEASTFTCMTFDWKPLENKCHLQEVSAYTHPETYEENTLCDSFQRNCV